MFLSTFFAAELNFAEDQPNQFASHDILAGNLRLLSKDILCSANACGYQLHVYKIAPSYCMHIFFRYVSADIYLAHK